MKSKAGKQPKSEHRLLKQDPVFVWWGQNNEGNKTSKHLSGSTDTTMVTVTYVAMKSKAIFTGRKTSIVIDIKIDRSHCDNCRENFPAKELPDLS